MGEINNKFAALGFGAFLALSLVTHARADATGYAALGDSFADEYQFYPPDRSTARNFVEMLATDDHVNFGSFAAASRGDPRNQGYANDWALSGAESGNLPIQTAGLAQQVVAGQVKTAFMFVGGNDFLDALQSPNAQTLLPAVPQALLTNVLTAAGTSFDAGITPLSAAEIIQSAKSVPAAVPVPRTWEMGLVGLLLVAFLSVKSVRRIFI